MTEKEDFLTVLSKIMQEDANMVSQEQEAYSKLYELINSALYDRLGESHYPNSPLLISELNVSVKELENYLFCPELFGKKLVNIIGIAPGMTFNFAGRLFDIDIPKEFKKIKITSPILAMDGEDFSVEVMTYANKRVPVAVSELECLAGTLRDSNIRQDSLIKYLIVKLPCKVKDCCFLFSRLFSDQEPPFEFFADKSAFFFSPGFRPEPRMEIKKRASAILYTDLVYNELMQTEAFSSLPHIHVNDIADYVQNTEYLYHGLKEYFGSFEAELLSFYHRQTAAEDDLIKAITDDIIRLDNTDRKFTELREAAEERRKSCKREEKALKEILNNISEQYQIIEDAIKNTPAACGTFSPKAEEYVLNGFFTYIEAGMIDKAEECIDRLKKAKYSDVIELAEIYTDNCRSHSPKKRKLTVPSVSSLDWSTAKILVAVSDLSSLPAETIEEWVSAIKVKRLPTGKELYAKALTFKDNDKAGSKRIKYLNQSFSAGYVPAGEELLELYEQGEKVDIRLLADSLLPEACMLLAQEDGGGDESRIGARRLLYYKLAASVEYMPAVAKIADMIYYRSFSKIWVIGDNYSDENKAKFKANANKLIDLCKMLIKNHYEPMRYTEMMGVTYYCLKKHSQAMKALSGINAPAANYCKGRMYEYGDGVSVDYDQALQHYIKAGGFKDSRKRMEKVQGKMETERRRIERENRYSEDEDYDEDRDVTDSYETGLCFITTAAVRALKLKDDCDELNELRAFRDEHINDTAEGRELVLEYYRIAPLIVEKLNTLPDADEEYLFLWKQYIEPSYREIRSGNWDKAKSIYVDMVKMLAERFDIRVSSYIARRYGIA